jgi:hypothetical protein
LFFAGLLLAGASRLAAEPLNSATVSRVENQVSYGKVIGDKSETRPAVTNDVIQSRNFLLSEMNSRAELRYEDGTIVRIGQNTIFTFEANNRIFDLKKGTFVFYVPKGKGGGTIKTQSFTAAITGTIGKVSDNIIACIEGEITLEPSGMKIPAGFFAQKDEFGVIQIKPFDPAKEYDGKLMTFNGPLPGIPESGFGSFISLMSELGFLESQSRTSNLPSGIFRFHPAPNPGPTPKETPKTEPTPTPAATVVPTSPPLEEFRLLD